MAVTIRIKNKDLLYTNQEIKGRFKSSVGTLKDQERNILLNQGKIKARWEHYSEELNRRHTKRTDSFEDKSFDEEPPMLGTEEKVHHKVFEDIYQQT